MADTNNNRIVSIARTPGSLTAGVATVLVTGINSPIGLTFSPSGDLVIAEDGGSRRALMLRASDNVLVNLVGGGNGGNMGWNNNGDGGLATNAVLQGAKDVAFTADNALLIPSGNSIRRVDMSTSRISTIVGPIVQQASGVSAPDGTVAVQATLSNAWGTTVDRRGNIYFVERDPPRMRRLSCS